MNSWIGNRISLLNNDSSNVVMYSALGFFTCYKISGIAFNYLSSSYPKMDTAKQAFWCSSAVSTLHAVIISILTIMVFVTDPNFYNDASNDLLYKNELNSFNMALFVGYILYDLSVTLYYGKAFAGWLAMLVHHICVSITWSYSYYYGVGSYLAAMAQLCELTTPFVNQRWFLYESNMKHTKFYFYNGLTLTFLWFITRILLYTYTGYKIFTMIDQLLNHNKLTFVILTINYLFGFILQYFWFYKILNGAIKTILANKERSKTL